MRLKKIVLKNKTLLALLLAYFGFFIFISFFYYQRLGAFGCFDDCFNYMGGYFLLKGKEIYTDFFFNHSFLIPYISFIIQKAAEPQTIYSFILYHRLFIFLFSFVFGLILIIRFRSPAFLTLIFYEMTKFYTFGDRFLGESFIVYPLIYLLGLVWEKTNSRKLKTYDYIITGIFVWFVIFAREPYAPLSLLLFVLILLGRKDFKQKIYSIGFFGALSAISFFMISPKDILLNVFIYNKGLISGELQRTSVFSLKNIFYFLRLFVEGERNIFHQILVIINAVFLSAGIYYSVKLKKIGFVLLFLILIIANLRPETPGKVFFEAYHMNVWFALLVFSTFLIIFELFKDKKSNIKFYLLMPFFILFIVIILSPAYFIKDKINRTEEFNTSYALYFTYGSAIKELAENSDTLFLEEKDELIYQIADLNPSYKYYGYTSFMPLIERYRLERLSMFTNSPPDFYYDSCLTLNNKNHRAYLPEISKQYKRIDLNKKPSCLLIKDDKLSEIPKEKWDLVSGLGFTPPN